MNIERIDSDVLIIGGGTSGCYCAVKLAEENPSLKIVIAEKANIKRSGCLASGVNALNAYISEGHVPEDYADYAVNDANKIARRDLLVSMSLYLNEVTEDLEKKGLVILKDENGKYITRGWRNLKINGENIKLILSDAVKKFKNIQVLNHVNVTDLKTFSENGKKTVCGAFAFSVNEKIFYDFSAKAVLVSTGGASGLYKPNNPGFSRHKMWYSPFNTGSGYAMGILSGAEMTSFEMRFIALRCKDTIAPTGTIAQGLCAKQVNSRGEIYEKKYGLRTYERLWGTVEENILGNGPCYLKTEGCSKEQEEDLYKAYLNMAPSQTLKWIEDEKGPSESNVEIEGTEPYIVGGHTGSGYWIDVNRKTTLDGLYAAGDVSGGAPQKYVTGSLSEAKIAAKSILKFLKEKKYIQNQDEKNLIVKAEEKFLEYESFFHDNSSPLSIEQFEEAMQKIMDEYAGGIKTSYKYNSSRLFIAKEKILSLKKNLKNLSAEDSDDLLRIYEIRDRLIVCEVLIEHLLARKETRWHGFAENLDYPDVSKEFEKFVNSVMDEKGNIKIILRDLA